MPTIIVNDVNSGPYIENEGDFEGFLKEFSETISKFDNKPQYELTYQIDDEEAEEDNGKTVKVWVSRKVLSDGTIQAHPKSNLYKHLCALNGKRSLDVGDEFEFDDLIGNRVLIEIVHEKKDDGNIRSKVASLRPIARRRAALKAADAELGPDDLPFSTR